LANLIVYSVVTPLIIHIIAKVYFLRNFSVHLCVAAYSLFGVFFLHVGYRFDDFPVVFGLFTLDKLILYIPSFVMGLWLWEIRAQLNEYVKSWWVCLLLAISLYLVGRSVEIDRISSYLVEFSTGYLVMTITFGLLGLFGRPMSDRAERIIRSVSNASYTIYLLHLLTLVLLAYLVRLMGIANVHVAFLFLTISAFSMLYFFHQAVLKFPLALYLLNGKR